MFDHFLTIVLLIVMASYTGCVADKNHRAFSYTEDSPLDWRSGFAVLTFRDGRLMYPELVTKWDSNTVQFRGELHKV